jgi:hypothetical protein
MHLTTSKSRSHTHARRLENPKQDRWNSNITSALGSVSTMVPDRVWHTAGDWLLDRARANVMEKLEDARDTFVLTLVLNNKIREIKQTMPQDKFTPEFGRSHRRAVSKGCSCLSSRHPLCTFGFFRLFHCRIARVVPAPDSEAPLVSVQGAARCVHQISSRTSFLGLG